MECRPPSSSCYGHVSRCARGQARLCAPMSWSSSGASNLIFTDNEPTPERNWTEQEAYARRAQMGGPGAKAPAMLAVQESRSMDFDDSYQEACEGEGANSTYASGHATKTANDSARRPALSETVSTIAVPSHTSSQHFSFWSDRQVAKFKSKSTGARYPNPFVGPKRAESPLGSASPMGKRAESPTGPRVPGAIAVVAGPWAVKQPRNSLLHSLDKFSTAQLEQGNRVCGTTRALSMPASLSGDFDQDGIQKGAPLARYQNKSPRWAPSKDTTYANNVLPSAMPSVIAAAANTSTVQSRARSSASSEDRGEEGGQSPEGYCVELETMVYNNSVRSPPKRRIPLLGETSAGRSKKSYKSVSQGSPLGAGEGAHSARLGYLGGKSARGDPVGLARVSFGGGEERGGGVKDKDLRTNSSRGGGKFQYVYQQTDTAQGQRLLQALKKNASNMAAASITASAIHAWQPGEKPWPAGPGVCVCV